MKAVNVSELKAHLSSYLRKASRGARIVIHDRDQPVAQIGPLESHRPEWRERLASQGRLRPGAQAWERLSIAPLGRAVDVQRALRDVREEPGDAGGSR